MIEIPRVVAVVAEVGEGPEDLHESLGGAVVEDGGDGFFFGDVFPEGKEALAVFGGVVEVGIVEEGGEIVFLASHAEALEVDEEDFSLVDHEIL